MKPSKIILLLTIAAILLTLFPRPAYACSCGIRSFDEEFDYAVAIFAGEVVSLSVPGPVNGMISTADPVKVRFQVQTVWKGPVKSTLVVTTPREDASCGYEFIEGETYLVYAFDPVINAFSQESSLETHLCTRNQLISSAGEDLAALGEGTTPPPIQKTLDVPTTLLALALLTLVLFSATTLSRRDPKPTK